MAKEDDASGGEHSKQIKKRIFSQKRDTATASRPMLCDAIETMPVAMTRAKYAGGSSLITDFSDSNKFAENCLMDPFEYRKYLPEKDLPVESMTSIVTEAEFSSAIPGDPTSAQLFREGTSKHVTESC